MYIVAKHQDFEQPNLLAAYHDKSAAIAEAERLVREHVDA